LRGLVAVLLLATLGAFGLTGLAVNTSQRAESQSRISQSREFVGYANDNLESDAELSTLLALQAVNTTYTADGSVLPEANTALHQATYNLRTPLRIPSATFGSGTNLPFGYSPDGTRIMYPTEWSFVEGVSFGIADARTAQPLYTLPGHAVSPISAENQLVMINFPEEPQTFLWDISSSESGRQISDGVPFH
jgi:hypothetical protein